MIKYREVAVSEFFEKNKHLLGFDNPAKALLTVVKEAVDNSLTADTPIVLEKNGEILIEKIGDFIDRKMKNEKPINLRNGNLQKLKISGIKALCFDKSTLKLKFKEISALYRHKVNSDIYKITLVGGRYVEVTDYHSIFGFKNGKIRAIKASNLKVGDYILVPKNEWKINEIKEINLLKEMLKLNPEHTENIGIYGIKNILPKIKNEILRVLNRQRVNDFKKCDRIPLNIIRKIKVDLEFFRNCKIDFMFGKTKLPVILKVDKDLAEFFGIYLAEGSISGDYKVNLSFGTHENKLIKYYKKLFEKLFGVNVRIIKAHKSAINLTANSKILCFLLDKIFKIGKKAKEKRMPRFIFNFPSELKEKFIIAYCTGDGYPVKEIFMQKNKKLEEMNLERIILATSSKYLCSDILYLLSSIGKDCSFEIKKHKKRKINNNEVVFSESYIIYLYTKQKNSEINKLPFEIIKKCRNSKLNYNINKEKQTNVSIENLLKLKKNGEIWLTDIGDKIVSGEVGLLKIKEIKKIKYRKKWVYDISVPEEENFVCGIGAIICHNSLDACEEAGILPDIIVKIKNIEKDIFQVSIEDNGPGIEEKYVKHVFGKLLFGSKFRSLGEEGIQSRGQQGIGMSASILYGQLTTGEPALIESKVKNKSHYSCKLFIDTSKNMPVIEDEKKLETKKEHGTKISLKIKGVYRKVRGVEDYLKYTAIANPHAQILFIDPENNRKLFKRVVNKLPKRPKKVAPHPHGVEIGTLIKMLNRTKSRTLQSFLMNDFSKVGGKGATEICKLAKLDIHTRPNAISREQAANLLLAMQQVKLQRPPTDCLSPIGEENITMGLSKEYKADFVAACTRPVAVYRAIPFQVEVGIVYSKELQPDKPVNLIRFANKVPLFYQQSECVIYKAVVKTQWKRYGLQQPSGSLPIGPVVILVHVASVWVPFISEGKQAIASYPMILKEIKLGLLDIGRKLKRYLATEQRRYAKERRLKIFNKYGIEIANALTELTKMDKNYIEELIKKTIEKRGL